MALVPLPDVSSPVTIADADELRVNAAQLGVARGITEQQRIALSILFLMYNLRNETGSSDYLPLYANTPDVIRRLISDANNLTQGFERSEFSTLECAINYGSAYAEGTDEGGNVPSTDVETLIAQTAPLWQLSEEQLRRIYLLLQYRCIEEEAQIT